MEHKLPTHIHEKVAEAIKSGKVTMHSSFHFLLQTILLVAALIGVFVVTTVILNFILFAIYTQSHHELLGFGLLGFISFVTVFPWMLFFIDIALVLVVIYLLRSFRIGYKTPVLYLGVGLVAAVVVCGFILEHTGEPLNQGIMYRVEREMLPAPFLNIFSGARPSQHPPQFCRCEVVQIGKNGTLVARDVRNNEVLTFTVQSSLPYATTSNLAPGDLVFIAGRFDGDNDDDDRIDVFGIKRFFQE